jgi:hypothetical protein
VECTHEGTECGMVHVAVQMQLLQHRWGQGGEGGGVLDVELSTPHKSRNTRGPSPLASRNEQQMEPSTATHNHHSTAAAEQLHTKDFIPYSQERVKSESRPPRTRRRKVGGSAAHTRTVHTAQPGLVVNNTRSRARAGARPPPQHPQKSSRPTTRHRLLGLNHARGYADHPPPPTRMGSRSRARRARREVKGGGVLHVKLATENGRHIRSGSIHPGWSNGFFP